MANSNDANFYVTHIITSQFLLFYIIPNKKKIHL